MLEVTNPPTKPVLAIHAGSVRRQAKLEVNQPFVIPHPGTQTGPVEVSLFQQLASHVLPNDSTPEAFCNIPVKKLDGQASQVQLRVRRGDAANVGKQQAQSNDSIGLTRDYLDHHQLQQRIQGLIQDVLREQPDNPYKYMLETLRKTKGDGGAKRDLAADLAKAAPQAAAPEKPKPLAPRPPDQPKPDAPRGRNFQAKPADAPAAAEEAKPEEKPSVRLPTTEASAGARFSVLALLRTAPCQKAADQSLRQSARRDAAKSISKLCVNSVKEKISAQAATMGDPHLLARSSIALACQGAADILSPQHHRAITCWAAHLAYRGACISLGYKRRSDEEDAARRSSVPQPIVFLESERSGWGSWLSSK